MVALSPPPLCLPGPVPGGGALRRSWIRALNEQLLLNHIRQLGRCSRADLARLSGPSKPTVSLALANVERSGLVREAGQRTGVPGRSALLAEIRPDRRPSCSGSTSGTSTCVPRWPT